MSDMKRPAPVLELSPYPRIAPYQQPPLVLNNPIANHQLIVQFSHIDYGIVGVKIAGIRFPTLP